MSGTIQSDMVGMVRNDRSLSWLDALMQMGGVVHDCNSRISYYRAVMANLGRHKDSHEDYRKTLCRASYLSHGNYYLCIYVVVLDSLLGAQP